MVAEILVLSLFDDPDRQLRVIRNQVAQGLGSLGDCVYAMMNFDRHIPYKVEGILSVALSLVGHDTTRLQATLEEHWLMSCYKGQTVYTRIFETRNIGEHGFLKLSWTAGVLR